ncbi:MAG: murein transglycosylase A [Burkholderiales bacterium]
MVPWRIATAEGNTQGLVTGYYEPLLRGSRTRQGAFQIPLYSAPDDLLTIDLSAINPELRNMRLRGRIEGRRVVPYFSRAEIDAGTAPLKGKELVWVDDVIEAFFLQIQGSGRIQFNNGDTLRLGYADQNGHPYISIGRVLIEQGELRSSDASMQGIQAWARANPSRLAELLAQNPSYVFFRELPRSSSDPNLGPPGALGVALTPQRSIAVDPRFIPLGAPIYLATTRPNKDEPLNRLVFAQDTGGAIRGAVRADYFWGFGAAAGAEAGRMRQQGRLWLLWPKGSTPTNP